MQTMEGIQMNMNQLPDDCLRLIFRYCPLRQHLSLRLVCDRWYSLVSIICTSKQSLKLFPNLDQTREYCHALVEYGQQQNGSLRVKKVATAEDDLIAIPPKHYHLVAPLFANVKHLVLCLADNSFESMDLSFLAVWTSLTSLTLFGVPKSRKIQRQLWCWINDNRFYLSQLYLFRVFNLDGIPLNLPVLTTLERISIGHFRGDISPVICQLGPNCMCISLDHIKFPLDQLTTLSRKLRNTLTRLRLNFVKFENADVNEILSLICSHFPRLTHLDFSFSYSFHLMELIPELTKLQELTSLRLCLGGNQLLTADSFSLLQLGQLPNIRRLHLTHFAFSSGNDELYFRLIPRVFPRLEVLSLGKHHATPWPLLVQLCELADLPALRHYSEYTFQNMKAIFEANLSLS